MSNFVLNDVAPVTLAQGFATPPAATAWTLNDAAPVTLAFEAAPAGWTGTYWGLSFIAEAGTVTSVDVASAAAVSVSATGTLAVSQALTGAVAMALSPAGTLSVQQTVASLATVGISTAGDLTVSGAPLEAPSKWRPGRYRLGTVEPRWRQWVGRGGHKGR
jgi:hypothetical protein